jgi:hypothetical protein
MLFLKVHSTPKGEIVALCDSELVGKVFRSGERTLDLSAHAGFYAGKEVASREAVKALRGAQNANLVGRRALFAAKRAGIATSGAVRIGGVPHLQVYSF